MTDQELPPIDPQEPSPQKPKTAMWVRISLFASVALNIAVIGLVIGTLAMNGPKGRDGGPHLRDAGLGPLGMALDRGQREVLRASLQNYHGKLAQSREGMRRDIVALLDILRAEEFDVARAEDALETQRAKVLLRQEIGHQAFIDVLTDASLEERQAMAERIEKALRRSGGKPKSGRGN